MRLLLITDGAGDSYLPNFERLSSLFGHKVLKLSTPQNNTANVQAACIKAKIDGILLNDPHFLNRALHDLPDFIAPPNNKRLTLDDYAGSYFLLRQSLPVVVLNPLDRLVTVPHERFVVDRYVSKLTKPGNWWKQTPFNWKMITESNLEEAINRVQQSRLLSVDIETPGDELRSISCVSYTAYFPETRSTESYCIGFDELWQWEAIKRINDTPVAKIFQNGMYDNAYFMRWNAPVRNWLHDTQHLFHSWLSELPKRLDFISSFALREVRFWKNDGKTGRFDDLCRYCCMDSWVTLNAYLALLAECPSWATTNYLQEFPLVFPGLTAGLEGMDIDFPRFKEVAEKKEKEVEAIRGRISKILGLEFEYKNKKKPGFNPNSPKQVGNLFSLLGVGYLGSTDKANMLKAKYAHPLNEFLLTLVTDYRQASKLHSNYFQGGKLWDGRLYYTFNPAGTDVGRLACNESSFWCGFQIQNIPRGDILKQCMVAPPGWYIGEADKSQSEARCVGYLAGDKNLIDLVEGPHDYHAWNAQQFFGIAYEKIYDEANHKTLDTEIRDLSKRTNHGANYNMGERVMLDTMGPKKVAVAKRVLNLPPSWSLLKVCAYLLQRYAETYPSVKGSLYEHIINTIEMTKQLVSPLGWVRVFFGNPRKHKPSLNAAVAHAPSNLSVSIVNKEWYAIWRRSIYGDFRGHVRIKAQIHDSLLFLHKGLQYAQAVHEMMQTSVAVKGADGVTRNMKIPTDLSTGKGGKLATRWSELK